jgi:transcriptional regulator with XRE-family HTH domain
MMTTTTRGCDVNEFFAERLKELRHAAGLTQEALAALAGVPVGTLREYEHGRRRPLFENVVKLAEALGLDAAAFQERKGK